MSSSSTPESTNGRLTRVWETVRSGQQLIEALWIFQRQNKPVMSGELTPLLAWEIIRSGQLTDAKAMSVMVFP